MSPRGSADPAWRCRTAGWRSALLLAAGLLVALVGVLPAPAGGAARERRVIRVMLVNHDTKISARRLRRGARVLTEQANRDFRGWWPGPRVDVVVADSNVGARWSLVLEPAGLRATIAAGVHGESQAGVLGIVFPSTPEPLTWMWTASHELLEMLEDPSGGASRYGLPFEICDPVEGAGYFIDGMIVSDFVTPAWFRSRSRGPWDYLSLLAGPRRQLA